MSVLLPFIVIAVLGLVEYLAARAWMPAYFRYGLPVFRMRVHGVRLGAEAEARLDVIADERASLIVFQRLSESEIAFRERGRSSPTFRYMPILHGLVRYVPEEGATHVIGWLNLFAVAAIGFVGYLFFSASRWQRPWELTVWFLLVIGVMYGIGAWRYRMVAKVLQTRDT